MTFRDQKTLDPLSLTQIPSDPIFFSRHGTLLSRTETLGLITSLDLKPIKFLKFVIDDDTGYVDCVLWLNHLTSPYFKCRSPSDVRQIAASVNCFASRCCSCGKATFLKDST
ncbi:hypothetical protein TorRG33x02_245340 [Trema orientale]|uniref:Nucleic acid-binding, OB-fold containing protein n=1 Tax=Trema orientale TaxID=63057 RepID=A0A2P5DQ87_TREOI|nr:hypothetical protein TorRG33x02_245340 [Trema orientale]